MTVQGDQLQADVRCLALPEGREVGSPGHAKAQDYLCSRMHELGLEGYGGDGYRWPFEGKEAHCGRHFTNLLGVLPGRYPERPPLLIAAHYDTCGPFPGADDNAAALAIALATVAPLRQASLERSVIYAFFDGEEPPFHLSPSMGSIRYYRDQRREPIHCALVMDLCGHDVPIPGLEDLLFITGAESDPGLAACLRRTHALDGMRPVATLNRYIGDMSDHHVFRIHARPYLFFSCGRWPHYHQPTDTPEKLNYNKMQTITAYLVSLATRISGYALEGPFEEEDTLTLELELLDKAVGPFLDALGFRPRTRTDMDQMIQALLSQFGL